MRQGTRQLGQRPDDDDKHKIEMALVGQQPAKPNVISEEIGMLQPQRMRTG